jgi:tetratricopeptide (TPR) repeat protein
MRLRLVPLLVAAAAAGLLAAGAAAARSMATHAAHRPAPPSAAAMRDSDIAFYRSRAARDSFAARDLSELGRLYLQRGRAGGDQADLVRAEESARRSLALRTGRNAAGFHILAASLLAQHRFVDALDVATRLVAADSLSISARALLGETQLELGRYGEARRTLGALRIYRTDPAVGPRLARWAELTGDVGQARRLLRDAADALERQPAASADQRAWFHLRLGDLALRYGHPGEAEDELTRGLALAPTDFRLLGAMARLEAARGDWRRAAEWGERAITQSLDPATLGVVSDAYRALGDPARAEEFAHSMEVAVLQQPGPFHRAWSLFLLDHGRQTATVLAKTEAELRTRRDVYGWDLYAWALHRSGRHQEAARAMRNALALGTRDPQLLAHAEAILR